MMMMIGCNGGCCCGCGGQIVVVKAVVVVMMVAMVVIDEVDVTVVLEAAMAEVAAVKKRFASQAVYTVCHLRSRILMQQLDTVN
jgi:hypothetical protein